MTMLELFYRFGVALALGMFIGMQRQYTGEEVAAKEHFKTEGDETVNLVAGARTFTLMALYGTAIAFAADEMADPLIFLGGMLAVMALIITAYVMSTDKGRIGITTEIASFLTIIIGAMCYWDDIVIAAALTVAITVLLAVKGQVSEFARSLTPRDIRSALIFAVITLIILPILPREPIGEEPFDVLFPYDIWLMVVFISGISFLGYILNKFIGTDRGIALSGVLGGMVSSTAATLTFAERSREIEDMARPFALAIMLAWAVMFIRVLVIVAVVSRPLFDTLLIPLAVLAGVALAYSFYLYQIQDEENQQRFVYKNPFELRAALQFGALYAGILLLSRIAQIYFSDAGVYVSSVVAGLVDLNAITLSIAELLRDAELGEITATQAIIMATISNTVFKTGLVMMNGAPAIRKFLLIGGILLVLAGIGLLGFL